MVLWRQDAVAVGTVIGSCEQRRSRFAAEGVGGGQMSERQRLRFE